MILDRLKIGKITIEVNSLIPEKILNIIWQRGINVTKIVKLNITTVRFEIPFDSYKEVEEVVKKTKGKVRIVGKSGIIVLLLSIKRKLSLCIGAGVFLLVLYVLSNYIWAIDIQTRNNLSPFEVRKELTSIGIKPGLKKSDINVYNIEKKMEDLDSEVMWVRARIEGSTLRVIVAEKVNPPVTEKISPEQVLAKMDGEVKRVFTFSGNPSVKPGDIVKIGDVLILPIQGKEGFEKEVKPSGSVIANTFYEKSMEIQTSGEKIQRTGEKDSDIYLNFWGKKIYLKKAINDFKYYDKIEETGGLFNQVIYFRKEGKSVNLDKDKVVEDTVEKLRKSLQKDLTNDAKIIDNKVDIENISEDTICVKVIFTVEQDIAENIS
ncbi:sporulation protein YqfD [Clostridium botulinum]|uniref:sporulation protein YqfD n=1 Tax=Clostridium botulinum TaxID=1491 RepID=UPI0013CAF7D5|nr:sporulation protein YqfD [Clostridium botulinum]MBN1070341.1 sporulation protein YqfD [Clostridium botulinum]NFG57154.1 sporulation protein YqfD [Clostridium botulinum]NFH68631.1 sporulation protein YqfD [Clostridium botulinum]NFN18218.1 sporulation protein YqfD [Clostridium botulinum]NFN49253.1 sporulation protein YqfD [Clostridium botulinum]